MDKDEFIKVAINFNLFDLFADEPEYEKATRELAEAVYEFYEKYKKIKEKYRNVGIGDTDTDKSIISVIYELIHYDKVRCKVPKL